MSLLSHLAFVHYQCNLISEKLYKGESITEDKAVLAKMLLHCDRDLNNPSVSSVNNIDELFKKSLENDEVPQNSIALVAFRKNEDMYMIYYKGGMFYLGDMGNSSLFNLIIQLTKILIYDE